jgi:threonine-phosphate decarboxylase
VIRQEPMREILDYCKRRSITVLVDETYVEFAEAPDEVTAIPLTAYYNNVIILRGISKFFAAPGLRLGYAVCGNPELLREINHLKNPWTINSLAAIAGEIMFTDEDYINRTRDLISTERKRVCARLNASPIFQVFESHANFALVKILKEDLTSSDVFDRAIRQHLMIRDCSTFPFLNNKYFRLCFMLPEQNDLLLSVLLSMNDFVPSRSV